MIAPDPQLSSLDSYMKTFMQKMFTALFAPFTPAKWHQLLVSTEWQNTQWPKKGQWIQEVSNLISILFITAA